MLYRGEPGADVDTAVTALAVSRVEPEGLSCLAGVVPGSPDELTAGHLPIIAPLYASLTGDLSAGVNANLILRTFASLKLTH